MSDLPALEQRGLSDLHACADELSLRAWHTRYFGKQGEVTLALKKVGEVPAALRRSYGQEANRIKEGLTQAYERALAAEKEKEIDRGLESDKIDVTLPGRPARRGRLHVARQMLRHIYAIFSDLGFQIYQSRDV